MEDWAEIRRLHRSERLPIREIARRLEVSRNTYGPVALGGAAEVRANAQAAVRGGGRASAPRALLASFPRMPASVIAERIGWTHSGSILRTKVAELRPEYRGVDPADRLVFRPGQTIQCDLWFPAAKIPVGAGQERILPVLVMILGFSQVISAVMLQIPVRVRHPLQWRSTRYQVPTLDQASNRNRISPRLEVLRQVPPRSHRSGTASRSLDHLTMIGPPPTPLRRAVRQQRLDPRPHLIGEHSTVTGWITHAADHAPRRCQDPSDTPESDIRAGTPMETCVQDGSGCRGRGAEAEGAGD